MPIDNEELTILGILRFMEINKLFLVVIKPFGNKIIIIDVTGNEVQSFSPIEVFPKIIGKIIAMSDPVDMEESSHHCFAGSIQRSNIQYTVVVQRDNQSIEITQN